MQRPPSSQQQQQGRFTTDAPITSSPLAKGTSSTALNTNSTTTTVASQQVYFASVEEEQNRRLDIEIEQLLNSFRDVVKLAGFHETVRLPGMESDKVVEKDKFRTALDGCVAELRAATIVKSCENLFTLTHDLKTTLLLNDTDTLLRFNKHRADALNARKDKIKRRIVELNNDLSLAIWEMESALGGVGGGGKRDHDHFDHHHNKNNNGGDDYLGIDPMNI
ncbi:5611_t:CDS:2 [Ambispora leptoticha]|uniref:5611_t:CDS:1 n=1 Tax=Ambispora leptoticha TaxID=144679 RepID=A0A9N8WNC3_9GLOM|nr:5611_t:CDS:2 [Ambispora leptoticha]